MAWLANKAYIGAYADDAAALAFLQAQKWDTTSNGSGTARLAMYYFNTTTGAFRFWNGYAWSDYESPAVLPPVLSQIADPPVSPAEEDGYLITSPASGPWTGKEKQVARWRGAAWRYTLPADGMLTYLRSSGQWRIYRDAEADWVPEGDVMGVTPPAGMTETLLSDVLNRLYASIVDGSDSLLSYLDGCDTPSMEVATDSLSLFLSAEIFQLSNGDMALRAYPSTSSPYYTAQSRRRRAVQYHYGNGTIDGSTLAALNAVWDTSRPSFSTGFLPTSTNLRLDIVERSLSTGVMRIKFGAEHATTPARPTVSSGHELVALIGSATRPVAATRTRFVYRQWDEVWSDTFSSNPSATETPVAVLPRERADVKHGWHPAGKIASVDSNSQFTLRTGMAELYGWAKGYPYRIRATGGTWYYGVVTNVSGDAITCAGADITVDRDDEVQLGNPEKVLCVRFCVPGQFADADDATVVTTDLDAPFVWRGGLARVVEVNARNVTTDTGESKATVQVTVGGNSVLDSAITLTASGTWYNGIGIVNDSNYAMVWGNVLELSVAKGTNGDALDLNVDVSIILLSPWD